MRREGDFFVGAELKEYIASEGSISLEDGCSSIYVDTSAKALNIKLPNVRSNRGSFVFVYMENSGHNCVITPGTGDTVLDGAYASYSPLTAVGDYVLLYCDGVVWYSLVVDITVP